MNAALLVYLIEGADHTLIKSPPNRSDEVASITLFMYIDKGGTAVHAVARVKLWRGDGAAAHTRTCQKRTQQDLAHTCCPSVCQAASPDTHRAPGGGGAAMLRLGAAVGVSSAALVAGPGSQAKPQGAPVIALVVNALVVCLILGSGPRLVASQPPRRLARPLAAYLCASRQVPPAAVEHGTHSAAPGANHKSRPTCQVLSSLLSIAAPFLTIL